MSSVSEKPLALLLALFLFSQLSTTHAEETILIPTPPTIIGTGYILEDFNSGKVLAEKNSEEVLAPASLTKIMTAYVIFKELEKGKLNLKDMVTVSEKAWKTPGSRMFIEVGKKVSIENLLQGMIIQSGNDASVALAEHVAGNETMFAEMMNGEARNLGLTNTHFSNSMGLPSENHHTTAKDLSKLTRALIKNYPQYYAWDSQKEFTYNKITQKNRNRLLWRDASVDGVKTGYTEDAGYCMVASAKRNGMRLISVVMGTKSESSRAIESQTLLNYGFRFYETHQLYKAGEILKTVRAWRGERKELNLGVKDELFITIAKNHYKSLKIETKIDKKITAPVTKGKQYGTINITLAGNIVASKPLVALEDIAKGSIFQRFYDKLLEMFE